MNVNPAVSALPVARLTLFEKAEDYEALESFLGEAISADRVAEALAAAVDFCAGPQCVSYSNRRFDRKEDHGNNRAEIAYLSMTRARTLDTTSNSFGRIHR